MTPWHHANMDRPWDCPLDCGAGETYDDGAEAAEWYELQKQEQYGYAAWMPGMVVV